MISRATLSVLALAALAALAQPAVAAPGLSKGTLTNAACSFTAIIGNSGLTGSCAGFYGGNTLNTGAGQSVDADEQAGLAALGLAGAARLQPLQKIGDLGHADAYFTRTLYGDTVVAFHFGNAVFPTAYDGHGGGTTYLRFDAGTTGIDILSFKTPYLNANSAATLYQTGVVPEPETYALMLAGLLAVGLVARRRA